MLGGAEDQRKGGQCDKPAHHPGSFRQCASPQRPLRSARAKEVREEAPGGMGGVEGRAAKEGAGAAAKLLMEGKVGAIACIFRRSALRVVGLIQANGRRAHAWLAIAAGETWEGEEGGEGGTTACATSPESGAGRGGGEGGRGVEAATEEAEAAPSCKETPLVSASGIEAGDEALKRKSIGWRVDVGNLGIALVLKT